MARFDRTTLEDAFHARGEMAVESGRLVEIAVYGGSALVLTLPDRAATRDVDAVIQNDAGGRPIGSMTESRGS